MATGIHHFSVAVRDVEARTRAHGALACCSSTPVRVWRSDCTPTPATTASNSSAWLDELRVEHSAIRTGDQPFPFATLVFRDPDNIQLELFTAC